jgi:hypothetical protein
MKSTAGRCDLIRSLSGMRRDLADNTDARVVLGGKSHTFLGLYPGILEEVLQALGRNQPLYVLGGFGGAASNVAQALTGARPEEFNIGFQRERSPEYAAAMDHYAQIREQRPDLHLPAVDFDAVTEDLMRYGDTPKGSPSALSRANGLSDDENRLLFATASLDEAMSLIMKGLDSVCGLGVH